VRGVGGGGGGGYNKPNLLQSGLRCRQERGPYTREYWIFEQACL